MSDFYGEMADIARDLMGEFKQGVVTLRRVDLGPVDPATPWIPPSEVASVFELDAVVKGVSEQFINGTTIVATDREVTCSDKMTLVRVGGEPVSPVVSPVEVRPGDVISVDGVAITIVKTIRIPAAGVAVAHKFIVR